MTFAKVIELHLNSIENLTKYIRSKNQLTFCIKQENFK